MKNQLFYSILRYKHGLVLGETLNAGILFFDPKSQKFRFERGDLKRIASSYPGLHVNLLKTYISVLESNIQRIGDDLTYQFDPNTLENFISKELLFSDAAGLTFGSLDRIPISESSDFQKTNEYIKQLFLVGQYENPKDHSKRNEDYILSEINKILKRKDPKIANRIERDKIISTPLVEYNFDFFWSEKSNHYVKALAFDLENGLLIQNKALQIFGTLEQLSSEFTDSKTPTTFDLLITKPRIREFFNDFDKALKIIDSVKLPVLFNLEDNWNGYTDQIVEKSRELTTCN